MNRTGRAGGLRVLDSAVVSMAGWPLLGIAICHPGGRPPRAAQPPPWARLTFPRCTPADNASKASSMPQCSMRAPRRTCRLALGRCPQGCIRPSHRGPERTRGQAQRANIPALCRFPIRTPQRQTCERAKHGAAQLRAPAGRLRAVRSMLRAPHCVNRISAVGGLAGGISHTHHELGCSLHGPIVLWYGPKPVHRHQHALLHLVGDHPAHELLHRACRGRARPRPTSKPPGEGSTQGRSVTPMDSRGQPGERRQIQCPAMWAFNEPL